LIKNHLFVTTELFEKQNGILTKDDFYPLYLTLKSINGVAVFDSGFDAGCYNNHRHFQIFKLDLEFGSGMFESIDEVVRLSNSERKT